MAQGLTSGTVNFSISGPDLRAVVVRKSHTRPTFHSVFCCRQMVAGAMLTGHGGAGGAWGWEGD